MREVDKHLYTQRSAQLRVAKIGLVKNVHRLGQLIQLRRFDFDNLIPITSNESSIRISPISLAINTSLLK